ESGRGRREQAATGTPPGRERTVAPEGCRGRDRRGLPPVVFIAERRSHPVWAMTGGFRVAPVRTDPPRSGDPLMALAALLLHLLGLLLAFGVRTLTAHRRTGDTGFRRPDTTPFTAPWWGTVLFAGALVTGLAAPAAGLFAPAEAGPPPGVGVAGLAL